MKILKCIICSGEVDILYDDRSSNKKIKCKICGFTNCSTKEPKDPEIVIIRRKTI